ncbi:MAG TPA: 23S rRNA (pseudouridine(1915)-N(3))-methyltransferase RlmH [Gemmatimonadales bacterium]|nr:23S rRNA (pseudouridine(1915)-N(3))-methyltransferase RlmH [Gemmatimonadales bacterium]
MAVLAVGRLRPAFRDAADDYLRRLGRYARVAEVEVREAGRGKRAEEGRRIEGARLRERVSGGAEMIALDRTGTPWTSEELARRLGRWRDDARPVAFLIGGAEGLDPDLVADCQLRWSLGALTLPHELARVVVLEQLYRGFTILRGEPYHK